MFLAQPPSPWLADSVALVWFARGATSPTKREWVLPSGTAQLLVNVAADRLTFHQRASETRNLAGVAVSGPFSRPLLVESSEQDDVCGVSFAPGGLARFFGAIAHVMHNEMIDLSELRPDFDRSALDAVRASDTDGRLDALERFVGSLVLARPREPAVGWAVRELETPERRVRDLVAESGMSKRRFVNTFRQNVGLSPKQFQRVRRLRRALHALERGTASAEAALAAGYYDQAHLIHEFQALAGMSPATYIRRRSGYSGHAAVD